MSLDITKLENVREVGNGKIEARCPACAEAGLDRQGNHLRIDADGRFCCVVNPGKDGASHRKRVYTLAGKPNSPKENFSVKTVKYISQSSYSIKFFLKNEKNEKKS